METGIYIRVNGEDIDIGNEAIEIVDLVMYIERMLPATRMRVIMALLNRQKEFEKFLLQ